MSSTTITIATTAPTEEQPIFEECRSKWHSTGHMDFTQNRTPVPLRTSMQPTNITNNPLCSEYASVDIQNISHYRLFYFPTNIKLLDKPFHSGFLLKNYAAVYRQLEN